MKKTRPLRVSRDLALLLLVGIPFLALWNWTLSRFWSEGEAVRAVSLTVQILGSGYFVLLAIGLLRGHRWVWRVLARGRLNPLGVRAYHDPPVREYFGIREEDPTSR